MGIIYITTNLVNKKQYIGQTCRSLEKRIKEHQYNNSNSIIFHSAIKKYGIENFKIISFSCPEENLDWTEGFLQKELNTIVPNGYNLILNEYQHKLHHEISKEKISNANKGQPKSEEWKKKMRKPKTEEHKQKLSESNKGKKRTLEQIQKMKEIATGKHPSAETKKLWSEQRRGENNPAARAVILISPEGQEYKLPCYAPFCREHGLDRSHLRLVLQGKRKHYKGWTGRYLNAS